MEKEDIEKIIAEDNWMMEVLQTVATLKLPNWYIGAGFIRSKVWDELHGYTFRKLYTDIDVLYYNENKKDAIFEKGIEKRLQDLLPNNRTPWEVRNQARMHRKNGDEKYVSTEDAIAHFPETVTAIGVTLSPQGKPLLYLAYGAKDLINMDVKPTKYFLTSEEKKQVYLNRVKRKNWSQLWPKVKIQTSL